MAQESPGFVYNIKEMANNKKRHETTTIWSSTGGIWAAESAQEGFFKESIAADNFPLDRDPLVELHLVHHARPGHQVHQRFLGQARRCRPPSQTHWALFTTKAIQMEWA